MRNAIRSLTLTSKRLTPLKALRCVVSSGFCSSQYVRKLSLVRKTTKEPGPTTMTNATPYFRLRPQKHSTVRGPFFRNTRTRLSESVAGCRVRFRSWGVSRCDCSTIATLSRSPSLRTVPSPSTATLSIRPTPSLKVCLFLLLSLCLLISPPCYLSLLLIPLGFLSRAIISPPSNASSHS